MSERVERAREALAAVGQEHVLRFVDRLDDAETGVLLDQVEALDLPRIEQLIQRVLGGPTEPPSDLEPPALIEPDPEADAQAREAGAELLAAGRVGAFLVAGGQGTRLGYDGPKGRFPVGPITGRSLFAYHAHRVLAACRRYDASLPLYVMTSPANDESTRAAFAEAGWFGLDPAQVMFLVQGTLPAIDRDGRLLLAAPNALSLSPDGHGGSFAALQRSGALDDMQARGVDQLFYFQVDNPLAPVFDPVFIGHHALADAQMSTKVVEKREPGEKVGLLARSGGRTCMVEYSDLPEQLAHARDDDGRLVFRAGNIAIHMLQLDFVRRILGDVDALPVHRADKKVPFVDAAGVRVEPDEPNAVKMELFVFDALASAERTVTQLVERAEEFSPVKNADGQDSPATARAALVAQAKRWLGAAGLPAPEGDAEVGPLFALDQDAFCDTLTRADFGPVFDRA